MARSRPYWIESSQRRGFTLVELLISLAVGLVVVAASLTFATSTFRGAEGNKLREEVARSARFIGMSLHRDVQTAGVGIESEVNFGTLNMFNDTLVLLAVPWEPQLAPAYSISPPFGTNNPLDPGGTCGAVCIDLNKDSNGDFDLARGDIARLQVNAERHLIVVTNVVDLGGTFQVSFLPDTTFLHYDAAFEGGLQLDRFGTTVQKLKPVVYFVEDSVLYRAESFDSIGGMEASPMAFNVVAWDTWLIFEDLDIAPAANITDADVTNDFDDLIGTRITATIATSRTDIRVNDGALFTRDYEWRIMPRNLMYERNR